MNFKRLRDPIIVVLALAVPFVFLRASMKDPRRATGADKVLVQLATPVQYAAAALARGVSSIWGDYVYLVDLKQANTVLAAESARLRQRVSQLEDLEAENRRLKRALDLKNETEDEVVTALVIAKDTNEFFHVIRLALDKSSPALVPDLPVMHPDGVVGTIKKISGDTVDVRLVADAGAGVDVVVRRTGARGSVRGTGNEREYTCQIQYMERADEVAVGDRLVTSGVGDSFPKGVDVCTVSKITKRDFGIFQEVVCTPTVDFSRLEEVVIVLRKPEVAPPAPRGATKER